MSMSGRKLTTPAPCIDMAACTPELAKLAKLTVRLHPRSRVKDLAAGESKFAGRFLWPADELWPKCEEHDEPYAAILQLRKADVPEMPFYPGADLFQLLWCPRYAHVGADGPRPIIAWRTAADIKRLHNRTPKPKSPDMGLVAQCCSLSPEHVTEYPRFVKPQEWGLAAPRDIANRLQRLNVDNIPLIDERVANSLDYDVPREHFVEWLHFRELSVCPSTKIGGYVDWVQHPDVPLCRCGRRMDHLLSLSSWEFDVANFYRWMPLEDQKRLAWPRRHLNSKRLAKVWRKRQALQSPTGLCLGDAGRIYLFLCQKCDDWPTKTVFQFS